MLCDRLPAAPATSSNRGFKINEKPGTLQDYGAFGAYSTVDFTTKTMTESGATSLFSRVPEVFAVTVNICPHACVFNKALAQELTAVS